jgi:hypothetical protein
VINRAAVRYAVINRAAVNYAVINRAAVRYPVINRAAVRYAVINRAAVRYAVNCRVGLCMCFVQRRVSRKLAEGAGNTVMRFWERRWNVLFRTIHAKFFIYKTSTHRSDVLKYTECPTRF